MNDGAKIDEVTAGDSSGLFLAGEKITLHSFCPSDQPRLLRDFSRARYEVFALEQGWTVLLEISPEELVQVRRIIIAQNSHGEVIGGIYLSSIETDEGATGFSIELKSFFVCPPYRSLPVTGSRQGGLGRLLFERAFGEAKLLDASLVCYSTGLIEAAIIGLNNGFRIVEVFHLGGGLPVRTLVAMAWAPKSSLASQRQRRMQRRLLGPFDARRFLIGFLQKAEQVQVRRPEIGS
ncbi:MAG: hypothetical protein C5B49_13660 [Bdellovibrio sp.]|nr:MAG: hypothetical protein C5B49_13660 [Bdellovibrio sp.]